MKLKITRTRINNILDMSSYFRYNFFVDDHYLKSAEYEGKPLLEEVYNRAYNYIVDNPSDVLHAINNGKLTINDCGWLNMEDILEVELTNLELDRKRRIIMKKLEDLKGDFE